jgi:NTP pyrophosphatase (non-canonical NTP hydrolase)
MIMKSARSTDQTNPEQCRHLGVDKKDVVPTMDATQKFLEEYREFVMSVASAGNKSKFEQVQQGCIGLSTESGELLDNLKKAMFQERAFDIVNAKEECGDALFYITELLDALDSDIFECMALNKKKLTARYGGSRFDKDKSLNRDTDNERQILEDRKTPPKPAEDSCVSCAVVDCAITRQKGTVCLRFKDNRNYPVAPVARKACCGNCAGRLALGGCETYSETNDDGYCVNHKFL